MKSLKKAIKLWHYNNSKTIRYSILFLIFLTLFVIVLVQGYSFLFNDQTAKIGDSIGGMTSPIINSVAALLVYIAFKEQKKANDIIFSQENFKMANEEINSLSFDVCKTLIENLPKKQQSLYQRKELFSNLSDKIDELCYFFREIEIIIELIEGIRAENPRSLLTKKLIAFYTMRMEDSLQLLDSVEEVYRKEFQKHKKEYFDDDNSPDWFVDLLELIVALDRMKYPVKKIKSFKLLFEIDEGMRLNSELLQEAKKKIAKDGNL